MLFNSILNLLLNSYHGRGIKMLYINELLFSINGIYGRKHTFLIKLTNEFKIVILLSMYESFKTGIE